MRKEDFALNVKIAWHAIKQNKQQQKKNIYNYNYHNYIN